MSIHQQSDAPVLASPIALPAMAAAGTTMLAVVFSLYYFVASRQPVARDVPSSFSQLSDQVVTVVPLSEPAAISVAARALELPDAQKRLIEKDALEGRQRLGWLVFVDSIDPDGDVIAVDAGGMVQHVTLSKAWTPVAVPLDLGPIGVTGVRDGVAGGITVALGTRSGPVNVRILLPGERIEVAAP